MSAVGGLPVLTLDLVVPELGQWQANAILSAPGAPAVGSRVTVTVADLSMVGTVVRSGLDAAHRPSLEVHGGAGWSTPVSSPMSFQSDAGVRLSTVLAELAKRSGETIEQPTDRTIGAYYECVASRPGDPVLLRDALGELYRAGALPVWRVDPDGVTRFGTRVGTDVAVRATVLEDDARAGWTRIGLDQPAGFLPGNLYRGVRITRLEVRDTSGKLEATVYSPTSAPPVRTSILRMVAEALGLRVRTYLVSAVLADKRLDLVPPPDLSHLPEIGAVEQWSLGGALVTPTVGSEVLVLFRDDRRARPVAFAFGPGVPEALDFVGGGPGVARVGDHVGRLIFASGKLWYSPGPAPAPYSAVAATNPNDPSPPDPTQAGTNIDIATGSALASCGG